MSKNSPYPSPPIEGINELLHLMSWKSYNSQPNTSLRRRFPIWAACKSSVVVTTIT